MRLYEARKGALDDREALRQARSLSGVDAEGRVVARGNHLAGQYGVTETVAALQSRSDWLTAVLLLLMLVGGFGVAVAALGDGSRPVNVIWTLGGLLGFNLLSLLLWLAGSSLGRVSGRVTDSAGGVFGRLWWWASRRLASGETAALAAQAGIGLLRRARLLVWWLGSISHAMWLGILLGVLGGMLLALSLRRYGFIWETTILPAGVFVDFVTLLGWLPARLGFPVPDAAMIRASGAAAGGTSEAAAIAWAAWLIGCVTVYGILPRLILYIFCVIRLKRGERRVRLDMSLPEYAALIARVTPASVPLGVSDAAPEQLMQSHLQAGHVISDGGAMILAIELRPELCWPPALPTGVIDGGMIDSREQRRQALTRLSARPPARLLLACDSRLSPDRGSLALIASLSRHAGDCRVWLMDAVAGENDERLAHWRDGLHEAGLPLYRIFADEISALSWLEHGDD